MNAGAGADDPTVAYYDSDYPWVDDLYPYPENFDRAAAAIGLGADVRRYRRLAASTDGAVLELCCGTGRVAIPLARDGHRVTAVDVSPGMLAQFANWLGREDAAVRACVEVVEADVTRLALPRDDYALAIMAFNSLILVPDTEGQRAALRAAHRHLARGGLLALDIANPRALSPRAHAPVPVIARRNVHTGRRYVRFSGVDALDADGRQRVYGWYDEEGGREGGRATRHPYEFWWRPIPREEVGQLLDGAGFDVVAVESDHNGSPYTPNSPTLFVTARKRSMSRP